MPESLRPSPAARMAALHDALLVLLIAVRPLVWDEDATQPWAIAYLVLVVAGLMALGVEAAAGWRTCWRISPCGLLMGLVVAWFAIEAWRSPLPLAAWGLWSTLAAAAGLAWYLMQVLPGRGRLAMAALGAGVLTEIVVATLQWLWVLPAMTRAQGTGHLAPRGLEAVFSERLANGGVFGTFTQANALAGFLLVALPGLAASGWRAWKSGDRTAGGVVGATLLLCVPVLVLTSSKAAYLALAAALVVVWACQGCPWLRPLTRACGIGGLALAGVLLVSPMRHRAFEAVRHIQNGLEASAEVRVGYWRAACTIIGHHPLVGVGLRGYTVAAPAALPVWAGYSTHAHCEPLEAAAEGGLLAGCAVAMLLAWLPWSSRRCAEGAPLGSDEDRVDGPEPDSRRLPAMRVPCLVAAGGLLYGALLGMLSSNTGWWPGASHLSAGLPLVEMAWWLLLAVLISLACMLLRRLPPPPAWACTLGLLALGLHVLVDFDLHSGGILGTAVVVAVLAGGTRWTWGEHARVVRPEAVHEQPVRMAPRWWAAGCALAVLAGALLSAWSVVAMRDRLAGDILSLAESALAPGIAREARHELVADAARVAGLDPAVEPSDARVLCAALERAGELAAGDYQMRTQLIDLQPAGAPREEQTAALASVYPASAAVQRLLAQDEHAQALRGGSRDNHMLSAVEHLRRATQLAPFDLRLSGEFARLLRQAASALPDRADALCAEAVQVEARRALLHDRVDWSNRD